MNLFHWRIPFLTILMGKKVNLTVVKHRYNQDFRPRSKLLHFVQNHFTAVKYRFII